MKDKPFFNTKSAQLLESKSIVYFNVMACQFEKLLKTGKIVKLGGKKVIEK